MKWTSLAFILVLSLLIGSAYHTYKNRSYEFESNKISEMICDMVSLRAQDGGTRDVYDQIFAFLRKHSSDPKADALIRFGGKESGGAILNSDKSKQIQFSCDIENKTDYKIVFAFAKHPFLSFVLAQEICLAFLFLLALFYLLDIFSKWVRKIWFGKILFQLRNELGLSQGKSDRFDGLVSKFIMKVSKTPLFPLKNAVEDLKSALESKQAEVTDTRLQLFTQIEEKKRSNAFEERVQLVRHDLKGPLSALKIATRHDKDQLESLASIISSVEKIVGDLDQYQIANSAQDLNFTTLEIAEVAIQEVIDSKQLSINSAQIEVNFQYDICKLSPIQVHPTYFRRVIANLIQNAIEASDKEFSRIKFSVYQVGETVKIEITDDGKGISADAIELIFENGARFDKPEGSGLGLYFVKRCIVAWQGNVVVNSTLGHGATFAISLPTAVTPAQFGGPSPTVGKLIILDDEFEQQKSIWESLGRSVVPFKSPYSFMDWIESEVSTDELTFIIDLHLRESINGLDVVRSMSINSKIYFSTSDYLNSELLELSAQRKIPILPKALLLSAHF